VLLRRYFTAHSVDLSNPKVAVLMIKHRDQSDWLLVKVTPQDQDKVERLIGQIASNK
jgi:hypothetical protein